MARCTSCGAELPDYYTSCPNCGGTQVVRGDSPAAPQSQSASYSSAASQRVVTSVGSWIGWLLLCSFFPLIGVIVMLCTVKDPSAKNYAKLFLIMMIVGMVIGVILSAIMVPAMLGYVQKMENTHVVYNMIMAMIG